MTALSFPSLGDLALSAFKTDDGRDRFSAALKEEEQKEAEMYEALINDSADYFIQKSSPAEQTGRSLIKVLTRSAHSNVKVQMTVFMCTDVKKEFMALSHVDIHDADDMISRAAPDSGIVYGGKANDISPFDEFMQTCIL